MGRFGRYAAAFLGACLAALAATSAPAADRRVPKMACRPLAAGAGARRLAQDLRRGDARGRARSDAARSRSAGPRGRAAARAGRVRADAGRLHQGGEHRAPRGAGARSSPPSTRARSPRSSSNSACRATCCSRSGAARPTSAATSCRRTPSPCSPPRAITGGARTCSGRSCSTRSRCWRRATSSSRTCAAPGAAPWG